MHAGNAVFTSVEKDVAFKNAPYNVDVFKNTIKPDVMDLLTEARDDFIGLEDFDSAVATFPLFCGDKAGSDTELQSCAKDVAGFLFYVLAADIVKALESGDSTTDLWQYALQSTYDEACYSIWYDWVNFEVKKRSWNQELP